MTELDQRKRQAVDDRIAELEAEVARLQGIEHGLELAASHAQKVAGRLQSILNNTSDAVVTLNDNGVIETVNPSTETMFGYDHGELIGQHAGMLVPEPGRTRVAAYMEVLAHRKAPPPGGIPDLLSTIHTTNAVRKDGTVFPVDLSVSEATVEGKPLFTGMIRDVTERVLAHQRVTESEERSRLVFTNAPIGLFVSSGERSITQANPALLAMLGRTEEEIVGKRLSDFGAPGHEQPAHTRDRLQHDRERDEPLTSERAVLRGDGTLMWAKVTASAIRDDTGELLDVLRMVEDITAQREVEAELLANETRYRLLFESSPMGIAVSTRQKSIAEVNPAFLAMFGRDEADVIGKRLNDFGRPGADQSVFNLGIRPRLQAGEGPAISVVLPLAHGDGSPMWARITASAVLDDRGELVHVLRIFEDITAQREAEESLVGSEERFRELFEFAPIGIAIKDRDNHIQVVNKAFLGILKRSEDQVIGKILLAFAPNPPPQPGDHSHARMVAGDFDSREFDREWVAGDGLTVSARGRDHAVRDKNGVFQYSIMTVEDVTERKIAEEELRGSERRFHTLFESAPIGIALKDEDDNIVDINPAGQVIFGRTKDELVGTTMQSLCPPWFVPEGNRNHEKLVAGEIDDHMLLKPYLRPNGQHRWVQGTEIAVRDSVGKFLYSIQALEDITDRKQAEEELKASEERFRQLFESSPLGMAVSGPDRAIERVNPALLQMLGRTEDELHGHRLSEFRTAGYETDAPSSGDQVRADTLNTQVYDRHFQRADGTSMWAKVTTSAFRDHTDGRIGILRTLDDITAEKAAADQVQESEARFRSLFESTPAGIALVAEDSTITAVNPALARLLRCPVEEILGKTLSHFRSPVHPSTGLHRTRMLASGGGEIAVERLLVRTDGTEVWTHIVTAPVRNEQDEFLFGVRMIVDISERKEVERLKDEFLGMVNHELRTPLTAIEAGVGLVISGALGPLPEKIHRMLEIAAENSGRLTRLVNDVLDLERMTAGRIELRPITCEASFLIEQATHAASAIADDAGVTIEPTSTDMRLVADPDRIVQALINLIANAVKFSPSGSSVAVGVTKTRGGIRFSVADHGRGIPEHQIPLIFDRFHQVQQGDSRNQGGTGLGLAICQWVVEQHGGRIWVESAVEHGSTFFFELPQR